MNFVDIDIPFDEAENYFKANNREKLNRLFYKDRNFDKLTLDTTYYLIGEKGSGKTTYCAYFCNNTVKNIHSYRYPLSVDDYNKIIQMKKDGKLNYTHYVTLWKAILLTKLLATIKDSEIGFFNGHIIGNIRSLLNSYNFTKITMDSFSPVSFMDNIKFASGVSGKIGNDLATTEGNLSTETITPKTVEQYVYEDNWLVFINRIADELSRLRLKNHHYLFIDGIDTRPSDIPYEEYKECVYPLVRAVYDLNSDLLSRIKDRNKGRLQIVLLTRLDIFLNAGLSNAGSKISDNSAFLNWSFISEKDYPKTDLFLLVNNMFNSASKDNKEQSAWDNYFGFKIKRGQKDFDSFVYFLRLTTSKPRDFVKLLKIAKEQCQADYIENPTAEIIESDLFQRAYSTYFAESLRTALGFYYDREQIKLLFDFIKFIKLRRFTYQQYQNVWINFYEKNALEEIFGNEFEVLELLFNFNLVAVIEDDSYYRWKYRECTIANYDYSLQKNDLTPDTKFVFHWATEKEFGLYLK